MNGMIAENVEGLFAGVSEQSLEPLRFKDVAQSLTKCRIVVGNQERVVEPTRATKAMK
jgi:hypothetical protein